MDKKTKAESMTDFGYQQIPAGQKANKVAQIFSSVAEKYDVMNDAMSLGIHRYWKHFTVNLARVRKDEKILDLASGTGDLAKKFAQQINANGELVLADINPDMLAIAKQRLTNAGCVGNVSYVEADAEALPFPENYFDCITIAFGLRNVTHKQNALDEMFRVLKPGGRCFILEFSKPVLPGLNFIYDVYSFSVLPKLGEWIANDADSYRYLAESIRMHPDQKTLQSMMELSGFVACDYHNLSGGIVALHRGYKS